MECTVNTTDALPVIMDKDLSINAVRGDTASKITETLWCERSRAKNALFKGSGSAMARPYRGKLFRITEMEVLQFSLLLQKPRKLIFSASFAFPFLESTVTQTGHRKKVLWWVFVVLIIKLIFLTYVRHVYMLDPTLRLNPTKSWSTVYSSLLRSEQYVQMKEFLVPHRPFGHQCTAISGRSNKVIIC